MNAVMMIVWAILAMIAIVMVACAVSALASFIKASKRQKRSMRMLCGLFVLELREILLMPTRLWVMSGGRRVRLANIGDGTHPFGKVTKFADAAITSRHLLFKVGTDADHIALAGATDTAIGTVDDEVATDDITDVPVTVNLLGKGGGTKRMRASEAIAAFVRVYQAANGKVASTGTRCVGRAITASAADGDIIEVDDSILLTNPAGRVLMFAGIHTWAGGAGVSNAAAVAGVLTTDEVLATPIAVAGAGLLQKAVPTADTVTFTTNANFANGDKIAYQVWRAA